MTEPLTNPFVLPGMGQGASDSASNPLLASMEMMRQAWSGLTGPGGLAQALPMTPPLSVEDLERRIAELRAVEGWLRMNLSMLSSTIQGMEVQRSTIATLRSFVDSIGAYQADPAMRDGPSPLEIVLGLKPAPGTGETVRGSAAKASAREPAADTAPPEAGEESAPAAAGQEAPPVSPHAASAEAISHAAQSASEAWWGLLQQQFNQIAAATAATMPGAGVSPTSGAAPAAADDVAAREPKSSSASTPTAAKPAAPKSGGARVSKPRKTAARKLPPDSDQ